MSDAFTVRLTEVFQGPMDLLLHLVREQEVEIHEVEIGAVIDGYLAHIKDLEELDIEVAGDFLVMAASLMAIKSRSLLPREEVDLEEELDPKDELIQRLIEYRRFKETADGLGERYQERAQLHGRGDHPELDGPQQEPLLDLGELTPWDLLSEFSRLMRETLANRPHHVRRDPRPLRFYVERLAGWIRGSGTLTLSAIVEADDAPSRESLVGSFCALLELVKLGLVSAVQTETRGEIALELRSGYEADIDAIVAASSFDDEATPEDEAASEEGDESARGESAATATEAPAAPKAAVEAPAEASAETDGPRAASESSEH